LALHAGVDWDWEMPAVSMWVFALGGAALAASPRGRLRPPGTIPRIAAVVACAAVGIVPGLVLVSQARLDDSADAFERGDCAAAISDANDAISALGVRPEPYEIRAFCRAKNGDAAGAVRDMEQAVDHDRDSWTYHYGLALARGAAGLDPRPEARQAARLNPLDPEAQAIARRLKGAGPPAWKREARALLRGASPFYLSER
jgi:hypothetical protein